MNRKFAMRNRITGIILLLSMVCGITGCGKGNDAVKHVSNGTTGVNDVLKSQMDEADGVSSQSSGTSDSTSEMSTASAASSDGIDLDLSVMSATMAYSEVLGMMYEPDYYMGKKIKMTGIFDVYQDELTGKYYFACIVMDETGCCSEGLEFTLKGEHVYPDDYPEVGTIVTVIGEFATYREGKSLYCTLNDAEFV